MAFKIDGQLPSQAQNPNPNGFTLFADKTSDGKPKWKDENGVIHNLGFFDIIEYTITYEDFNYQFGDGEIIKVKLENIIEDTDNIISIYLNEIVPFNGNTSYEYSYMNDKEITFVIRRSNNDVLVELINFDKDVYFQKGELKVVIVKS